METKSGHATHHRPAVARMSRQEVSHMHPLITSQIAADRHREMLAQAAQERLAREVVAMARAARRAERAERPRRRGARLIFRLRPEEQ
jgi:hypothetical protein